ncbi:MAG: thiol peroxidase [Candidatus Omnitrophica bacterium]|nr:thiol peroxidase [Candidatus Omnitrophota bacterium]
MAAKVTFKGGPLTLEGTEIRVGVKAPEFTVVNTELKPVTLADFKGKVKVITTFPSVDTPVCDLQVKEFNKRAAGLGEQAVILAVSKDLPFAQARYCGANGIKNLVMLSDYQTSSLALAYGLLIKELKLLARSIILVDKDDTVRYVQIVGEVTEQPKYDEAIAALKKLM